MPWRGGAPDPPHQQTGGRSTVAARLLVDPPYERGTPVAARLLGDAPALVPAADMEIA